jgi:predicted GNAT family N-acyltransferase
VVERALVGGASAQIDNPTPEKALMLIAAEWSQFTENVTLSADEALSALVERFGVKAVAKAFEADANKVEKTKELVTELQNA